MEERMATAIGYPYEIPARSFVFEPRTGAVLPYDAGEHDAVERIAVLAAGSNASPRQLRRKFPASGGQLDPIPVVRVSTTDLDAVYAARVSRYGAVPATPLPAPGVTARLHVTLLTAAQLDRMNVTEGVGSGYELVELPTGVVRAPDAGTVWCYRALAGALLVDGTPVALRAIEAEGRSHPAWDQAAMLEHVAASHRLSVAEFVARIHDVEGFHGQVNRGLRPDRPRRSNG